MNSTAIAFKDEYDEVSVSSIDETSAAAIRDDIKELRSELRAMATKAASDLKDMWDRIDRQFTYFREDMREMRAETKQLREKMEDNYEALDHKIDRGHAALNEKIDRGHATLNEKIDQGHAALNEKIDRGHAALNEKIDRGHEMLSGKSDATHKELGHLSSKVDHMRIRFSALQWILNGLGALGGLIAGIATLGSAFHWF